LLLDHGHADAAHYALGRLYDEANLVRERVNSLIITEGQLAQHGVAAILSAKARKAFSEMVKKLNIVTKPIRSRFD
jgi:hypothetical protein